MRAVVLSPPVGMTLYVIQAVRREGNIKDVFAGTIPFVAAMSGASFDSQRAKMHARCPAPGRYCAKPFAGACWGVFLLLRVIASQEASGPSASWRESC